MRLGLGTAQFGLDYGITNKAGRVVEAEVGRILDAAEAAGITILDTAPAYGVSEEVLGRFDAGHRFNVITKTPKNCTPDTLYAAFRQSFKRLGRVYALLVHDGALTGPNRSEIWHALEELKLEGLVEKVGVSIYDWGDIPDYPIDIIQVPFNALDRRLIYGGHLERLKYLGVEVHARSVFLQGLLLGDPTNFPPHLAPLAEVVDEMQLSFVEQGLSVLEGVLAAALQCPYIDRCIVGVASVRELQEVVDAAQEGRRVEADFVVPPAYINPARWPELA